MSSSKGGSSVVPRGWRLVPAALLACACLASCMSHITVTKLEDTAARPHQSFVYHLPMPVVHVTEKREVPAGMAFYGAPVEASFQVLNWPDPAAAYVLEYEAGHASRDDLKFTLENGILTNINLVVEDRSAEAIKNVVQLAGKLAAFRVRGGEELPEVAARARVVTAEYDLPLTRENQEGEGCGSGTGPVGGLGYGVRGWKMIATPPRQAQRPGALWTRRDYIAYRPGAIYQVRLCYHGAQEEVKEMAVVQHFAAPAIGEVAYATAPQRSFVKRTWKADFPKGGGMTSYQVDSGAPAEAATGAAAGLPDDWVKSQTDMLKLFQDLLQQQADLEKKIEELSRKEDDGSAGGSGGQ